MTAVHVVHYLGATAQSQSVVASIARDVAAEGGHVTVVDISRTTTIVQGLPSRRWAKLFGQEVFTDAFAKILDDLGIEVTSLPRHKETVKIADKHEEALQQALESEMLTYFRLDHIPASREAQVLEKKLRAAMLETYSSLTAWWSANPPNRVLIPNGRTSRQKAARLVAEELGIEIRLYENGRAQPHSYYLGRTQPHDRVSSQSELREGFPLPQGAELARVANTWLRNRMSGEGGTNSFSEHWDAPVTDHVGESTQATAVFFASSFDEFRAFGPMWNIDQWSHQFEAFDHMMSLLEAKGVRLVLRLHPNLGSKSRTYFLREVRDVLELKARHPTLTIHWHNEATNSYDLVKSAQYVIVERSTIGLEASAMGKPVWVTQASQWDAVADIRQVLCPADITAETMELWEPSPAGAQQFVAYWMAQENPLHYSWDRWATWNPDKAPPWLKAAQLTLPNSWRHKKRLLSIEWSKWRNARFAPPVK